MSAVHVTLRAARLTFTCEGIARPNFAPIPPTLQHTATHIGLQFPAAPMDALGDSQGLIVRALAWNGAVNDGFQTLCDDIYKAVGDLKQKSAARAAASVLVANPQLPTLQRAQCETSLALASPNQQEAKAHREAAQAQIVALDTVAENNAGEYGLQDPRVQELKRLLASLQATTDVRPQQEQATSPSSAQTRGARDPASSIDTAPTALSSFQKRKAPATPLHGDDARRSE